jgi:hypothetical protein
MRTDLFRKRTCPPFSLAAEERRRTSALSKQILFEVGLVKRFVLLF